MDKQSWKVRLLKDISDCLIGITYKPENVSGKGIIVLRSGNIKDDKVVLDDILRINKNIKEKFILKKDDILMCSRNGSHQLVGKCTLIKNLPEKMTFGAFMTVIRSQYKDFLYYFFKSSRFRCQLTVSKTSTINQITISMLKEIIVPVPPLPIQNQIVKELDTLQTIINKKKAQLAELDKLAQATFYEMFGDPVENEKGWEFKGLDFLCEKITDGEHFRPEITQIGIPFLSAKDILQDDISFKNTLFISQQTADKALKRCNPEKNDLLIVSRGATVGRMNIIKTDKVFCLLGSVILLKLKTQILSTYFLLYTLRNPDILNKIKGLSSSSAQQALYLKDLRLLSIPLPPFSLQNQFAKRIEAIEKQKTLITQSITETQLLFDSAMDNYFN